MIETNGLRKSFRVGKGAKAKTVEAVAGLDLKVDKGEIFGFLGPNGAGKTTTLRMLATLITLDAGEATVAGADLRTAPREVRKRIGYVAQGGTTTDEATGREELIQQARMYGVGKPRARQLASTALDTFELSEYADRLCKTYSGGQRRRVDIAMGVIHDPQLLFLDEPTTGLDPHSRARVWDEVRRLRTAGMTVFLTTHYLDEADALCDRIVIIDHGEIVAEGTPDALKQDVAGDVVTVGGLDGRAAEAGELLTGMAGVRQIETDAGHGVRLYVDNGATAIPQVLRKLDASSVEFSKLELSRPSLDDVFLIKTGRSLRET